MPISKIGTSRVKLGSGTAAGAIVYVDVNTAGLRSWKPPLAVQGKDAHFAKANPVRSTSLVSIGVMLPLRLVKVRSENSTA